MKYFTKGLQAVGIVLTAIGLLYGSSGEMGSELKYAVIGVIIFFIGWFIKYKVLTK